MKENQFRKESPSQFTCNRPSSVRWIVTHLLGCAPFVVIAVINESNSSRFSFSFFTSDSMARFAKLSLSPPCRWHISEWTIDRHASADVGAPFGIGFMSCNFLQFSTVDCVLLPKWLITKLKCWRTKRPTTEQRQFELVRRLYFSCQFSAGPAIEWIIFESELEWSPQTNARPLKSKFSQSVFRYPHKVCVYVIRSPLRKDVWARQTSALVTHTLPTESQSLALLIEVHHC